MSRDADARNAEAVSEIRVVPLHDAVAAAGLPVRRAVPQRGLDHVGPWVWVDVVGPRPDAALPAHPQAGVQSLTWLFSGRLRHRDGLGTDAEFGPGQVLMVTSGAGLVSEQDAAGEGSVHGVALGLALPAASRFVEPGVEEFWPEPVRVGDHEVAIFVGEFGFEDSPVVVHIPALGAEVRLASDEPLVIDVPEGWEYGVLTDTGAVWVDGADIERTGVPPGHLAVVTGAGRFAVHADASAGHLARLLLLGGPRLSEATVHWWNFLGGSHDDVAGWRDAWHAALDSGDASRFPLPPGADAAGALRAPALPPGRLVPRRPARR